MAFGHRHLGAACIPFHHVGAGDWCPHGDSNPGRETENLASWPLDDTGKTFVARSGDQSDLTECVRAQELIGARSGDIAGASLLAIGSTLLIVVPLQPACSRPGC